MKYLNQSLIKSCIMILALGSFVMLNSCGQKSEGEGDAETTEETSMEETEVEEVAMVNSLTEAEKADGWILMFDGETSTGWHGYGKEEFPGGWSIEDGSLKMNASGRGEAGAEDGGDIIYEKEFENFHWKLEWKISVGGNSGIFYLGQETEEYDYIWKTAPEMQVLHPEHKDWNLGKDGNRRAGSLYDLIPADPQNAKEAGEWNQVEIIVKDGNVKHIQNGEVVVEYQLWTPEWEELVAGSKFPALNENWAKVAKKGYLGLQDHGDDVWYRNLKVKAL